MDQQGLMGQFFDASVELSPDNFFVEGEGTLLSQPKKFITLRRPINMEILKRERASCARIIEKEFNAEMIRLARKMSKININGKLCVDRLLTKALIDVFKHADYQVFGPTPDPDKKFHSKSRFYVLTHPDYVEFSSSRDAPGSYKIARDRIKGRVFLFPREGGGLEVPIAVGRYFDEVVSIPFDLTEDNVEALGQGVDVGRYKNLFTNIVTAFNGRKKLIKNGTTAGPRRMRENDATILDMNDLEEYTSQVRAKSSRPPRDRYINEDEWKAVSAETIGLDEQQRPSRASKPLKDAGVLAAQKVQQEYFRLKVMHELLGQQLICAEELTSREADIADRASEAVAKQRLAVRKARTPLNRLKSAKRKFEKKCAIADVATLYAAKIPASDTKAFKRAAANIKRTAGAVALVQEELERRQKTAQADRQCLKLASQELRKKQAAARQKATRAQEVEARLPKMRILFTNAAAEFAAYEQQYGVQEKLSKAQAIKIWIATKQAVTDLIRKPCLIAEAPEVELPLAPIILQAVDIGVRQRTKWWQRTSGNREVYVQ